MKESPIKTQTHGPITIQWFYDCGNYTPWKNEDGHGSVRHLRDRGDKRPGERPLGEGWFYDWQEAIETAKRDKWGPGTPSEAVESDFQ